MGGGEMGNTIWTAIRKLPEYRGMMPNFWTMYHGDKKAGITVHTMDEELDRGKIILQDDIDIRSGETLDSLIKRSKTKAADLTVRGLKHIKDGRMELKDYQVTSSYFSFPDKRPVAQFRKKGHKWL